MSGNKHIYEAWVERTFSEEKGRHVIHFYLASTSTAPLLAVVGTEKGDRHYSYVVCQDFLEVFGSSPAINAHTEWTSRRRVKEWLNSLVRKDDLPPTNSNLHNVSTQGDGSINALTSEPSGVQEPTPSHKGNGNLDATAANEPSGVQEPSCAQLLEPTPRKQPSFQVGDNIEVLSKDVDMHDCWYRCKILESCKKCLKVQFNDRKNEDGSGKLEDYIPARRLAPPDNLSMRHSGRLTIRPCPPEEEPPTTFEVGAAVDAWWKDGWWEGFVSTAASFSSSDGYHVFLPGPGKFVTLPLKDLRASRDWVDDTWVLMKSHPDMVPFVLWYLDNSHNCGGKSTQLSN